MVQEVWNDCVLLIIIELSYVHCSLINVLGRKNGSNIMLLLKHSGFKAWDDDYLAFSTDLRCWPLRTPLSLTLYIDLNLGLISGVALEVGEWSRGHVIPGIILSTKPMAQTSVTKSASIFSTDIGATNKKSKDSSTSEPGAYPVLCQIFVGTSGGGRVLWPPAYTPLTQPNLAISRGRVGGSKGGTGNRCISIWE